MSDKSEKVIKEEKNTPNTSSSGNGNIDKKAKCSWCDNPRMRNDLCNACRQKVESRARRLTQQKLIGDVEVIGKVMKFTIENVASNTKFSNISKTEYNQLLAQILPFLVCFILYYIYYIN